jgi:hypothetical protein
LKKSSLGEGPPQRAFLGEGPQAQVEPEAVEALPEPVLGRVAPGHGVALGLKAQKAGQKEGPGELGGIGDQKDPALEVGPQEEEVLVGALASGLAKEGLLGHAPGHEVAAAGIAIAQGIPGGIAPGHGDAGGEATFW